VVVTVNAGLIVRGRLAVAVPCGVALSLTVNVIFPLNVTLGTPLITPVEAAMVNAAGNPAADQVYGGTPPPAASPEEYKVFTDPVSRDGVVMLRPALIVKESVCEAVLEGVLLSRTVTVMFPENGAAGKPEICPELALITSGDGNPVADHVYVGKPPEAKTTEGL
jgi:hypothetical protein